MRIGVVAAGLLVLFCSKAVQAQEPEGVASVEAGVAVRISGVERTVSLRIADRETDRTVALCRGPCAFRAPRGRYVVYSTDAETGERRELGLQLRHDDHFYYRAGDDSAKTTGLVIGIAGPALIVTGMFMLFPALMAQDPTDGQQNAARIGLAAMWVGAVATPIGWTTFASNRTKLIEASPNEARRDGLELRLGLARFGPSSLGIAGTGHF
jgi:hypothetical protein